MDINKWRASRLRRRLPVPERRKRDAWVAIEAKQAYPLETTRIGERRARGTGACIYIERRCGKKIKLFFLQEPGPVQLICPKFAAVVFMSCQVLP